ncbi:hypothetical protein ACWEFL_35795 [Streptomyces sp. NPDC004838]
MTTSSLVLRGRDGTARLDRGDVLLDQDGIRRIPLAAVEEVRAADGGLTLEIVLTTAGGPATVYRLRCRSAAAVTAFTEAVCTALPERGPGEPRQDGAALVQTTPGPGRRPLLHRRGCIGLAVFLTVCLVNAVVVVVWGTSIERVVFFTGWIPLVLGYVITTGAGRGLFLTWLLRRRGITVLATRHPTDRRIFQFTDATGAAREFNGTGDWVNTHPPQIHVTYDPTHPNRMVGVEDRFNMTINALYLAVLGLPLLGYGLICVPGQFIFVLLS